MDSGIMYLSRTRQPRTTVHMTVKILVVDDEPDLEVLFRQRFRKQVRDKVYSFGCNPLSAMPHFSHTAWFVPFRSGLR